MSQVSFQRSQVSWSSSETRLMIQVSGEINETFLSSSLDLPSKEELILNLKEIKGFNSTGVRQWLLWMDELKSKKVFCEECSVHVIDNLNLVSHLLGNARILSFYAPYYDEAAEEEVNWLIFCEDWKEQLKKFQAPPGPRPSLVFDAIPEHYFRQIIKHLEP